MMLESRHHLPTDFLTKTEGVPLIVDATKQVSEGQSLSQEQMTAVFDGIMKGDCSDSQIKALLVAVSYTHLTLPTIYSV